MMTNCAAAIRLFSALAALTVAGCCANKPQSVAVIGQTPFARGYAPAYERYDACPQTGRILADHELCKETP